MANQTPPAVAPPANDKRKSVVVPEGEEAGYLREMKALIAHSASDSDRTDQKMQDFERDAARKYLRTPDAYSTEQQFEGGGSADMIRAVAAYQDMEFVDLASRELDHEDVRRLIRLLGPEIVRGNQILPLRELEDGTLEVAISDPLNVLIADSLRMMTEKKIKTVVANEDDILDHYDLIWGMGDATLQKVLDDSDEAKGGDLTNLDDGQAVEVQSDPATLASQPPVIRLVNTYLMQVIRERASDLHVEPYRGMVRIRARIDGALRELPDPPKHMQLGLVSRLKVLANMNIAENRMPQDGRIRLSIEGREVDLRVSSMPTVHGESIVMRILDKSMMMLSLDQLGMPVTFLAEFNEIIHRPNGILLVCGPTGSGKTTTLYAALGAVNDPGDKIITTEDPVEYQLPGLLQININTALGLTFATCLRSILRHDPDIILVGEIRDVETAQIAIQASLTGHMVFSTIHANSATTCATRLIDMGVEPFLITSTLQAILAQRLVRTICKTCSSPYRPTDEELRDFSIQKDTIADYDFRSGEGCEDCSYTGFKGRMGIYEMMVFDEPLRDLILARVTSDELGAAAVRRGMDTMRVDGWAKICAGTTTFAEVARQTPKENELLIKEEMQRALHPGAHPAESAPAAGAPEVAPPTPGQEMRRLNAPWEEESASKPR
ncbi:MAG: GspE/PulE family protein [Candidatus Sumerlaeota bacterium]|nr:GspE/PulE family protein [Candidatus Sumerlaeota bacterium]